MKRSVCIALCLVMISALVGCGKNDAGASHKNGTSGGIEDVLSDIVNSGNASPAPTDGAETTPTGTPKPYITSAPVDPSAIDPPETRYTQEYQDFLAAQEASSLPRGEIQTPSETEHREEA